MCPFLLWPLSPLWEPFVLLCHQLTRMENGSHCGVPRSWNFLIPRSNCTSILALRPRQLLPMMGSHRQGYFVSGGGDFVSCRRPKLTPSSSWFGDAFAALPPFSGRGATLPHCGKGWGSVKIHWCGPLSSRLLNSTPSSWEFEGNVDGRLRSVGFPSLGGCHPSTAY